MILPWVCRYFLWGVHITTQLCSRDMHMGQNSWRKPQLDWLVVLNDQPKQLVDSKPSLVAWFRYSCRLITWSDARANSPGRLASQQSEDSSIIFGRSIVGNPGHWWMAGDRCGQWRLIMMVRTWLWAPCGPRFESEHAGLLVTTWIILAQDPSWMHVNCCRMWVPLSLYGCVQYLLCLHETGR